MASVRKKIVVVGDGGSGKTCLLIVYCKDQFPQEYIPRELENTIVKIQVDDQPVELALWDTTGEEFYNRDLPMTYRDTDMVVICFSIDKPQSLNNIPHKWKKEAQHCCPTAPIVLVGTKKDLRDEDDANQETFVQTGDGQAMAERIGACAYLECSARLNEGVKEVFEAAAHATLNAKKCSIM